MKTANRNLLAAGIAAATIAISSPAFPMHHTEKPLSEKPNGSFVSLKGTALNTGPSGFVLDYGEGTVVVETDDWDSFKEGELVIEGDTVTVYGLVDNDFYQKRTIEAEGIYIDDIQSGFTNMSATDEEDLRVYYYTGPTAYDFVVMGEVTLTDGREFYVDTGTRQIKVDTSAMPYNPMDDLGIQKIETGDIVRVSGGLDIDLFESREIMADTIVSLNS